jgi:hypothetical protein
MRRHTLDLAIDILACGIDPERTTLFVQAQVPDILHEGGRRAHEAARATLAEVGDRVGRPLFMRS